MKYFNNKLKMTLAGVNLVNVEDSVSMLRPTHTDVYVLAFLMEPIARPVSLFKFEECTLTINIILY